MKAFSITVTYVTPRTPGTKHYEIVGPIFGKRAANDLCIKLLQKRNVIGVKVIELKDEESQ